MKTQIRKLKTRLITHVTSAVLLGSCWMSSAPAFSWGKEDLWRVIADQCTLLQTAPVSRLQKEVNELSHYQPFFNSLSSNAKPYLYYVYQQTQMRNMPAELALLPIIESNYYPFANSNKSASGLWQMMSRTASGSGVVINWWFDGRRDVLSSTNTALDYLQYLHKHYHDWLLALAAYNAGIGKIDSAIRYNKKHHLPTNYWSLKLPKQTEQYVPKLLAVAMILQNPRYFHIHVPSVSNEPTFAVIKLHKQVNIEQLAEVIHMDSTALHMLNAGFRRSVTPNAKSYDLIIPVHKIDVALREIPNIELDTVWEHHPVSHGETLTHLAMARHTSVTTLRQANQLKSERVRPGQDIVMPTLAKNTNDEKVTAIFLADYKNDVRIVDSTDQQHVYTADARDAQESTAGIQAATATQSVLAKVSNKTAAIHPAKNTSNKPNTSVTDAAIVAQHTAIKTRKVLTMAATTSEEEESSHYHFFKSFHLTENTENLAWIAKSFYTNITQLTRMFQLTRNTILACESLVIQKSM